jgi:ribonuclease-3
LSGRDVSLGGSAPDTAALEATLGHAFKNRALLVQALTHRSALGQRYEGAATASNERLEFLGDRVLGIVIAERLLTMFPGEAEGSLAPRFAALVAAPALAEVAAACDIAGYIRIAPNQRANDTDTAVLADACEALIGALYLDGGLGVAKAFILSQWEERMGASVQPPKDPKTALQEWAQGRALPLPDYRVISNEGPSHAPVFVMAVSVKGIGEETGTGRTKRQATSAAAAAMLARIAKEAPNP